MSGARNAGESRSLLRTFYLDLADFTADYVRHLRDEGTA